MDRSSEILAEVMDVLSLVWFYITEGISAAVQAVGSFIQSLSVSDLSVPMPSSFPTVTKVFQNPTVCYTAMLLVTVYIIIINISAFHAFGKDKKLATRQELRISEKSLMRRCMLGGALGGFIGMKVFHHKTLKKRFNIGVPLLLAAQIILFSFIMGFFGFWLYIR